jgi:hypothetical protein
MIPTISKTSLTSIDESIQTTFHIESPEEEINNDEKLDIVDEDVNRFIQFLFLLFIFIFRF